MGGVHGPGPRGGGLVVGPAGPLHRADPAVKLVATLVFVAAVVATPTRAVWAYGAHTALLAGLVVVARIPAGTFLRRLVIEVPFLLFAAAMPFAGPAPRVQVAGVGLSTAGLWSAWGIAATGTLGVGASVLLAGTTPATDLLDAMRRLRVPRLLVAIVGFMVRYAEVVADEMGRMRVARLSRGADPRWLWQGRAIATSAGALFVRSYERGERVHLAMLSRGFTGSLPELGQGATVPWRGRAVAAAVVTAAWAVSVAALVVG